MGVICKDTVYCFHMTEDRHCRNVKDCIHKKEIFFEGEKRMHLDLGCGGNKQKGFIGMDCRPLDGVDIVWNITDFPWPIEDGCCRLILASHLFEHIEPKYSIALMDECWRVLQDQGEILISVPYPGSRGFWQDPTHCNGWNEATWQYFDPTYPLWNIYKPKTWEIKKGFPVWSQVGNLEVVMIKQEDGEAYVNSRIADMKKRQEEA